MDVSKILAELKAERPAIEEAILCLERLAQGGVKVPGMPPNWMADIAPPNSVPSDDPEPPLETASVAVPVPRPKPNLPPATAAAVPVPHPKLPGAVAGRKRPVS